MQPSEPRRLRSCCRVTLSPSTVLERKEIRSLNREANTELLLPTCRHVLCGPRALPRSLGRSSRTEQLRNGGDNNQQPRWGSH